MPEIVNDHFQRSKKRKRGETIDENPNLRPVAKSQNLTEISPEILELERSIRESQKNYNCVLKLLAKSQEEVENPKAKPDATITLCRVLCRLYAQGRLKKSKDAQENQAMIVEWLRKRAVEYQTLLDGLLRSDTMSRQRLGLTLYLQLVKEEYASHNSSAFSPSKSRVLRGMLKTILSIKDGQSLISIFTDYYVQEYNDICLCVFLALPEQLSSRANDDEKSSIVSNGLTILSKIEWSKNAAKRSKSYFFALEEVASTPIISAEHRKQAQNAWLSLIKQPLSQSQRKIVLSQMTTHAVPCFSQPELLMDFLSDSFDAGGSLALLSLSGLFHLMSHKSLDYPSFYRKLYSLLDEDVLHSKHRSHFFKLLDIFLSSSHLPAALVASFMKRLSRLALHAPPGAIVAVIPWCYNLLKSHSACTFMIHREPQCDEERTWIAEFGAEDPFGINEMDPMKTGAIDSCLWELVSLQSHYHPSVSSLAKIISQQFTKQSYNLEDFLDHSYSAVSYIAFSRLPPFSSE